MLRNEHSHPPDVLCMRIGFPEQAFNAWNNNLCHQDLGGDRSNMILVAQQRIGRKRHSSDDV
jgi:hypothetical protein